MRNRFWCGGRPLSVLALLALAACGGGGGDSGQYSAEIRRTAMGVPHIKASNWGNAGYGYGYAQAQDNLCTMADSFLTYRGERSRYFGGDALLVYNSTIARPRNIDSDFFHRHVISTDVVDAMAAAQPDRLQKMVAGFAAGYNRYLREAQAGGTAHAACRTAAWVQPITAQDIWRRLYAANLAGGYSNFVAALANATPPAAAIGSVAAVPAAARATRLALRAPSRQTVALLDPARTQTPQLQVGGTAGIGSNVLGFGTTGTGDTSGVLFGNPHWYWKGPDRFYQAQLTIPGELNVSGASFLGMPVVQVGFNDNVAWSHTVSAARRFGFFQLKLATGDNTSYVRDGKAVKMVASDITVQVLGSTGALSNVTRTLYKTEYGPMVNLSSLNPALAWTQTTAFAMRDVNGDNFRTVRTWLRWNQAASLDEFMAIQKEEAAIPWVNTVAVGRGNARAWYADIGAVPNVSPEQTASCTTNFGKAVAAALPNVPFFDGSNSACDWQTDSDSVQKGTIGVSRMPSLLRDDYVGNMNDSYWLTNAKAPLTGFPPIFGVPQTQTLRTRLGHTMALERLAGTDGYAGKQATSAIVRQMVLGSRVFSAERFKDQALSMVCAAPQITVTAENNTADVTAACATLRAWDNTGNATAQGTHVWDEFWSRALKVPAAQLFAVPFSAADPLNTPRDLQTGAADALRQAFGAAVLSVQRSGFAVNAPRGDVLFATRGGSKIALYGGCSNQGYFTVNCSENPIENGGYSMDGQPHGNGYMQVVSFPSAGVEAYSFLTYSLSDDPASSHNGDYTKAYGAKQWLRVPFSESEIKSSTGYATVTVRE